MSFQIKETYAKYIRGNNLIKSFGIYTIAKVINSCIPFFLLPVMTAYLSPADYGTISMITTIAAFALPFVSLRVDDAIVRRYYYKNENIAQYIGNCLIIVGIAFFLITIFLGGFSSYVSKWSEVPQFIIWFIPLYCLFSFFKNIMLFYWQVNCQPVKYGLFSILLTLLEVSIAIVLVVYVGMNWMGRAVSLFTAGLIATLFTIAFFLKHKMIDLTINHQKMSHALKYGAGLIPAGIGASLMMLSNRFFLTEMISIDETGLYGVATSFASIMSFITLSFNNAFVPWLFEKLNKKDNRTNRNIVGISYIYMVSLFVIGALLYLAIRFIFPFFVNSSFDGAMKYIPLLLLGYTFQGCYFMVTNYIMYAEKTYYTAIITIVCGLISIALNYLLINAFGAIGAALAFAITFGVFFLSTWIVANRVYPMPWGLIRSFIRKDK